MTEPEYKAALLRLRELWPKDLSNDETGEFLDLSAAIEAYETEHHPIREPTPEEAAAFRKEQEGGQ